MISKKLLKHLDESSKKYEVVEHRTVYTAYDAAATMKVKLDEVVKTLLIKTDKPVYGWPKGFALALLPANKNIDFKKFQKGINIYITKITPKAEKMVRVKKVEIPKENVMTKAFKVKPGGMHAFGSLFKVPVFIEKSLTKQKKVIFPAGTFTESIKMSVKDYIAIEEAVPISFGVAKKIKKQKKKKKK